MSKISKKQGSAAYVQNYTFLFKCPVCGSEMDVVELSSLRCEKGHSFDFAKQGYVNMVTHPIKTKYSKELFEARGRLMANDRFFDPLTEDIAEVIPQHSKINGEHLYILDTGCGEGTHLTDICNRVANNGRDVVGAGIDLAKEGVLVAARNYSEKIWCVADLARTPFKDEQFDVILNILSPSNYGEFSRLLKPGGLLIKAVPQSGYLQELRKAFYSESEKESYSNEETVARFNEKFHLTEKLTVHYTKELGKDSLEALVAMTPLGWGADERKVVSFLENTPRQVTVDLEILIGEKQ